MPPPPTPTSTSSAWAPPSGVARTPPTPPTCSPPPSPWPRTWVPPPWWSASPPSRSAPRRACASGCAGVLPPWNPEFLREGFAIEDTVAPDRFVYGVDGDTADADVALLDQVYAAPLATGTPRLVTDFATAELVKVSANAFLATKISFINAMAEVCEA